jgi:hypothetical protein
MAAEPPSFALAIGLSGPHSDQTGMNIEQIALLGSRWWASARARENEEATAMISRRYSGGHPLTHGGGPSTIAGALLLVALVTACASAGASLAPGSPMTSDTPLPSIAQVTGLDCSGGPVVSGDIDRAAGTAIDVVQGLNQDFEGLLATDELAVGLYEGRPAVIVSRDQRVAFIGSYGQDGRIYQYTMCAAAAIKVRGSQ